MRRERGGRQSTINYTRRHEEQDEKIMRIGRHLLEVMEEVEKEIRKWE